MREGSASSLGYTVLVRASKHRRLYPLLGLVTGGCSVDEEPPRLVSVEFEDETHLRLRFSEPLASVDEVEPALHFRIGSGFYIEALGITAYYDLAHHFPYGVPGVEGGSLEQARRHGFTRVSGIEAGPGEDELVLELSYRLESYVCETLVDAAAIEIPAGIHLHYAEASSPRITDLAGNPLADVGAWFVTSTFSNTRDGAFPELDTRLPIPCP